MLQRSAERDTGSGCAIYVGFQEMLRRSKGMIKSWIKPLFIIAGLYDGLLALAFLFFANEIFQGFGVEAPNHPAYIKFPALLLLIFAAMFLRIAGDPVKHRELMLYGVGLKIAYSGTAFWYQFTQGISFMWIPWAWADLVFLVLFLMAWKSTAPNHGATAV
jgi:hypothetical protein